MKNFKLIAILLVLFFLNGCVGNMNPTGGNSSPNYPYFVTKKALIVKKILVPKGTKLVYEESFLKEGEQEKMMSEKKLTSIEIPIGETIDWGGVPVTMIDKFFNDEMCGFSVYADFNKLSKNKKTKFSELWESCSSNIGITVENIDDWSFNTKNISDVESCSVLYQRFFKDNKEQNDFLDEIHNELKKIDSK